MRKTNIYNEIMKTNRIKELREDNDIKQKMIYTLLNITQGQYSRIENGKNELSYDGLIKLALFYNVSIDYILCLTDEKKPYTRTKPKK